MCSLCVMTVMSYVIHQKLLGTHTDSCTCGSLLRPVEVKSGISYTLNILYFSAALVLPYWSDFVVIDNAFSSVSIIIAFGI